MKFSFYSTLLIILSISNMGHSWSQVSFNANTKFVKYEEDFLYGSNMGYYYNWTDADVGDILTGNLSKNKRGIGVNSLRPALYENFCEKYGYDSRIPFFKHYQSNGAINNSVFIGDRPTFFSDNEDATHQENAYYCKDEDGNIIKVNENGQSLRSLSFKNLYDPIWITDNGKTVINKNNIYAYYVYRLVEANKDYIKFYEIKNEPDFTLSGSGDKAKGENGNWWDQDPNPATLPNLYAPIQSYIRMLRISYEVIKTLSPDSYVCVGGLGYASFLDAILRNTDNPDGGKVTSEYPYYGGAWFDCVSYHIYPMYYLKTWHGYDKDHPDGFTHFRHSDAAVEISIARKEHFEELLAQYGYNGLKYPKKEVIITETNVPSKAVRQSVDGAQTGPYYIGGETVQRNYLLKLAVTGQIKGLAGIHVYGPNDNKEINENGSEYDYKGFYHVLPEFPTGELREHESAKGWRTISNLLKGKRYNVTATSSLNLPDSIVGGAFGSGTDIVYALWAKTTKDLSENVKAEFTFPDNSIASVFEKKWDAEKEDYTTNTIIGKKIKLTGDVGFYITSEKENIPVSGVKINNKDTIRIKEKESIILEAEIYPKNATNQNIVWSSNDSSTAIIKDGILMGVKYGITTINVKTEDGEKIDSRPLKVEIDTIPLLSAMLTDTTLILAKGSSYKLTPIIAPANATIKEVEWGSNASYIASVDKDGIISAGGIGEANIGFRTVGTDKGNNYLRANCKVKVVDKLIPLTDAKISDTNITLIKGQTYQLSALISPEDASVKRITWGSNASYVAKVDGNGLITAVKAGKANVGFKTVGTDKGGNNLRGHCDVVVVDEIIPLTDAKISNTTITLLKGQTYQLSALISPEDATNKEVTWGSNASYVAKVDGNGLITAVKAGKANVGFKTVGTDKGGNNLRGHCDVVVVDEIIPLTDAKISNTTITLLKGQTYQLSALISPEDATNKEVTWGSNASYVAKVDGNGLITAVKAGKANVGFKTVGTDKGGNNLRGHCDVVVVDEIIPLTDAKISNTTITLLKGQTYQLSALISPEDATNKEVTWGSNASYVAKVDGNGLITAVKAGKANVGFKTVGTDKGGNNLRGHCDVVVVDEIIPLTDAKISNTTITLLKGQTYQLSALISPEDATNKEVTWGSNASYVAKVDGNGLITAVKAGKANVGFKTVGTDKGGNNLRGYCDVVVVDEIIPMTDAKISNTTITLLKGQTFQLSALISPEETSIKEVTWGSNASYVAKVDGNGLITAVKAGKANVGFKTVGTDKGGNNLRGYCDVVVVDESISKSKEIYPDESICIEYGALSIKLSEKMSFVRIYNQVGNIIKSISPNNNEISIPNLPQGILFIYIETDNNRRIMKKIQMD
ncbi:MAG: Ig-like domain-containing protein [Dysgonomonas sp.]